MKWPFGRKAPDSHEIRGYFNRAAADEEHYPSTIDPRIFHVRFDQLIHDPVGSVRAAYQRWQLPFTTAFEEAMRAWLASPANRSDRYGRYQYSLEPFGLNVEQVRRMFARYSYRFELDGSAG